MRSRAAGVAVLTAVLTAGAAPAAATPVGGQITRVSDNVVRVTLTNTGSSDDIGLAVEFHPPVTVVSATRISGPPGNCGPASEPNRVLCLLDPPGLAPGASIVIEVVTNPRVEDNAGANAYSCGIPCNTSMMSGPYAVSGPSPTGGADLDVTLAGNQVFVDTRALPFLVGGQIDGFLELRADLTNLGPSTAVSTTLSLEVASGQPIFSHVFGLNARGRFSQSACFDLSAGAGSRCNFGQRQRGDVDRLLWTVGIREPGQFLLRATGSSDTPDPGPSPNVAEVTRTVDVIPSADLKPLANFVDLLTGDAEAARSVLIGIARLQDGARLASSSPSGSSHERAHSSAAACQWVRSARVRFRRERGRRCNDPSYLTAKVRRGKWKLRLRRPLPRGKYVAFVRGVGRDRVVEASVSARDKNLRAFRVR
jgi:hypothetical protein